MEKIIITSCPFPMIELCVNLNYAAVQKPSGVGYIILVLIKEAKDRNEFFVDVLKRFGVPEDLQFIFADEIEVLINRTILKLSLNNDYNREYFEAYEIGNFEFTSDGERMFREGAIPTGEIKSKQLTIYFDPLTYEFSFTAPQYMALERSNCYPAGFMERVETDLTGLKEYLIDNARSAGLQKEERLLECSIAGREDLFSKADDNLELHVDEDGMEVSLKTAGAEDFYEKYFTPDMVERELAAKKKFKFNVPERKVHGFSVFKELSAVYLPEEYAKQMIRPTKLLICRNGDKVSIKRGGIETSFESGLIINAAASAISSDWSFLTMDSKEMRFYTASNIRLTERVLDKPVCVSLLVEQVFGEGEKLKIMKAIFGECTTAVFSSEHCNLIKTIYELSGNLDFIVQYTKTKLKQVNDRAKQSEILLAANKVFINPEWAALVAQYASDIYNGLIAETTKENISYSVQLAKNLDKIRNPEKDALLLAIAAKFSTDLDDEQLFILLSKAGFTENEALSVANVVKVYIEKTLAGETCFKKNTISDAFAVLSNNLGTLKENLGIQSTVKYSFRENYDKSKFTEDYKSFQNKLNELKKYTDFAPDGFGELAKYESIMQPVFNYIIIERNASQNPEKISESYIRSKVSAGDWRTAIGDMVIRLDYVLSGRLEIVKSDNVNVFEKIDRAEKAKIITPSTAEALHDLRKFRNKLQHPTNEQLLFDKNSITKWADAVFSITSNDPASKLEGIK